MLMRRWERRYLTVLFCDLVGSTGISSQLDAEEWRDLVGSYLDAASAAVAEMGGHVANAMRPRETFSRNTMAPRESRPIM
jgi:class 3 adenylate cyclase